MENSTEWPASAASTEWLVTENASLAGGNGGAAGGTGSACRGLPFAMFVVLNSALCLAGLVGNSITCLVMWPDRSQSGTAVLLVALGVVDNLVILSFTPLMAVYPYVAVNGGGTAFIAWVFPYLLSYGWPAASVVQVATAWFIVALTFQRYVAVCRPHAAARLTSARAALWQAGAIVVFSLVFNVPRFLEYSVVPRPDGKGVMRVHSALGNTNSFIIGYKVVMYYVVVYALPLVLLLGLTVCLLRGLRDAHNKVVAGTAGAGNRREQRDVTVALLVVMVVFVVCQLLNPFRRMLEVWLSPAQRHGCSAYSVISSLSGVAVVINSSVNFVVFCLIGKGFRGKVLKRLGCKSRQVAPESTNTAAAGVSALNNVNNTQMTNVAHTSTQQGETREQTNAKKGGAGHDPTSISHQLQG